MTPQEHIDKAEELLNAATGSGSAFPGEIAVATVLAAIAHALIATAVENGAPHPPAPPQEVASV